MQSLNAVSCTGLRRVCQAEGELALFHSLGTYLEFSIPIGWMVEGTVSLIKGDKDGGAILNEQSWECVGLQLQCI